MVEGNQIVCRLTDEERKALTKNKLKRSYLDTMEKDYWRKDVKFSRAHVEFAERGKALAICACEMASMLGIKIMAFSVYGLPEHIAYLVSHKEALEKMGINIFIEGCNHLSFYAPVCGMSKRVDMLQGQLAVPLEAHQRLSYTRLLVDIEVIRGTIGDDKMKVGGFVKTTGAQDYVSVLDGLDALTCNNLQILNELKRTSAEQTSVFG